jgi:hypothetical protein
VASEWNAGRSQDSIPYILVRINYSFEHKSDKFIPFYFTELSIIRKCEPYVTSTPVHQIFHAFARLCARAFLIFRSEIISRAQGQVRDHALG